MREKHGMSKDPMYKIWVNIKNRCSNKNDPTFCNYGGRGISLHPEWRISFIAFSNAMGVRPSPRHTVERIDNEKGYIPGNIKWATRKEQAHNMRKNIVLTFNGRTQILAAWAEEVGLVPSTLWYRLFVAGMSIHDAIITPRRGGRRPTTGRTRVAA